MKEATQSLPRRDAFTHLLTILAKILLSQRRSPALVLRPDGGLVQS